MAASGRYCRGSTLLLSMVWIVSRQVVVVVVHWVQGVLVVVTSGRLVVVGFHVRGYVVMVVVVVGC